MADANRLEGYIKLTAVACQRGNLKSMGGARSYDAEVCWHQTHFRVGTNFKDRAEALAAAQKVIDSLEPLIIEYGLELLKQKFPEAKA